MKDRETIFTILGSVVGFAIGLTIISRSPNTDTMLPAIFLLPGGIFGNMVYTFTAVKH